MSLSVEKAIRAAFNGNAAAFGNKFADLYLGRVDPSITTFPYAEMWAPTTRRVYTTTDTIGECKDVQITFYAQTLEEIDDADNPQAYATVLRKLFTDLVTLDDYGLPGFLQMREVSSTYFQDSQRSYHYTILYEAETFRNRP